MTPQERIARLREFPVGDQDEFHVLMQEAEIAWLLDVAEAALRVDDAYPDARDDDGSVMQLLHERLYGTNEKA